MFMPLMLWLIYNFNFVSWLHWFKIFLSYSLIWQAIVLQNNNLVFSKSLINLCMYNLWRHRMINSNSIHLSLGSTYFFFFQNPKSLNKYLKSILPFKKRMTNYALVFKTSKFELILISNILREWSGYLCMYICM